MEYTLVDDNHFLGAGFKLGQLHGYYMTEDLRHTVKVLPGLKTLRYLTPFRDVDETIEYLRGSASAHPGGFAAMGDDLEKFGVWPGTHDLCYRDGWLENFFRALEQCGDWLEVQTPAKTIASHEPLGRADLPAASYTEMMEWALPTEARRQFHALLEEFSSRPDAAPFLRGGLWRNFFTKYAESNLMHKKMLHVSQKLKKLSESGRGEKGAPEAHADAMNLLLRAQCNDAYWHGVFGGLYSPHLRTAVWRPLVEAEEIADCLDQRKPCYTAAARFDYDADGHDEIYLTSEKYAAVVSAADGGTISALDFRPSGANVINSLQRRPETYHSALKTSRHSNAANVQSIHEQHRAKEQGLERWLKYDRWARHSFRLLVFPRGKEFEDCAAIQLDEDEVLAGGRYEIRSASDRQVVLTRETPNWQAEKVLTFYATENGCDVKCDLLLRRTGEKMLSVNAGIELVINFLAPSAPDRYFQSEGRKFSLRWACAAPATDLSVVDEWQQIRAEIRSPEARNLWISPIETVSESEEGFERIYQGSQVMAVWPVALAGGQEWKGQMTLRLEHLSKPGVTQKMA